MRLAIGLVILAGFVTYALGLWRVVPTGDGGPTIVFALPGSSKAPTWEDVKEKFRKFALEQPKLGGPPAETARPAP